MKYALASLAALAHETRLRAFRQLVEAGTDGMAVGELREFLELPAATLSAHLNVLRGAELVVDEREGRVIRVRAHYAHMEDLIAYLTENCCASSGECAPLKICKPKKSRRSK